MTRKVLLCFFGRSVQERSDQISTDTHQTNAHVATMSNMCIREGVHSEKIFLNGYCQFRGWTPTPAQLVWYLFFHQVIVGGGKHWIYLRSDSLLWHKIGCFAGGRTMTSNARLKKGTGCYHQEPNNIVQSACQGVKKIGQIKHSAKPLLNRNISAAS